MPRHKGDHDARRRDVSAAVWRVLVARGFGGLTLRAVATEMGATTGLITHYFPSKKDLLAHALTVLDEHRATRPRRTAPECPAPPEGLPALRAALMETLPLTREAVADSRIWVSSWDAALADPSLTSGHGARYARSRERIRHHVRAAQLRGSSRLPTRMRPPRWCSPSYSAWSCRRCSAPRSCRRRGRSDSSTASLPRWPPRPEARDGIARSSPSPGSDRPVDRHHVDIRRLRSGTARSEQLSRAKGGRRGARRCPGPTRRCPGGCGTWAHGRPGGWS